MLLGKNMLFEVISKIPANVCESDPDFSGYAICRRYSLSRIVLFSSIFFRGFREFAFPGVR